MNLYDIVTPMTMDEAKESYKPVTKPVPQPRKLNPGWALDPTTKQELKRRRDLHQRQGVDEEQQAFEYNVRCDSYDKGNFVDKDDAIASAQKMIYGGEKEYTKIEVKEIKSGDIIWEWHGKKDVDEDAWFDGKDEWAGGDNAWSSGEDQWAKEGVDYDVALTNVDEDSSDFMANDSTSPVGGNMQFEARLSVGDPVIVTAPNAYEGKTGEIAEFSPSGRFVIVNLYNHGEHSMHLSDVEYNQYADEEDELDEGFQDFNKREPYEVCLVGKPVKTFDYYEDARRFHDNWKKKLYAQGEKAKADRITLNPVMKEAQQWQGNKGAKQSELTDHTMDEAIQYVKGNYPAFKKFRIRRAEPGFRANLDPSHFNRTNAQLNDIDSALDYLQLRENPVMSGSKQVTPSIGYSWHTHENRSTGIAVFYYEDRGMGWDEILVAAKNKNNLKAAVQVFRDAGVIPQPKSIKEFAPTGNYKPPVIPREPGKEPFEDDPRSQTVSRVQKLLDSGKSVFVLLPGAKGRAIGTQVGDDHSWLNVQYKGWQDPKTRSRSRLTVNLRADDDASLTLTPGSKFTDNRGRPFDYTLSGQANTSRGLGMFGMEEGDDLGNLDAEVFSRIDKEKQRKADLKKNDPAAYAKEKEKDSKNYGRGIMGALRRQHNMPLDEQGVKEGTNQKKPLRTHTNNCGYSYGHDCDCNGTLTHANDCHYRYGHDCDCGLDKAKKPGVAEGDDLTHAGQDVMVWTGPPTANPPKDDKQYWIRGQLDSTEKHGGAMRANVMTAKGMLNPELSRVFNASVAEAKADPTGSWIVYQDGKRPMRFKTHTGATAYAEKNGGKVASSEFYADKIQKQGVAEAEEEWKPANGARFGSREEAVYWLRKEEEQRREQRRAAKLAKEKAAKKKQQGVAEVKQRLDAKCWAGKHKEGTKIKGGVRVNNCVPNESVEEAQTDYEKRRAHEKQAELTNKPKKTRQPSNDYFARRAKEKRDLERFGESTDYWAKLQNERNTRLNSLVDELSESVKNIK